MEFPILLTHFWSVKPITVKTIDSLTTVKWASTQGKYKLKKNLPFPQFKNMKISVV